TLATACGVGCVATATNEMTWLATFRGRAGFAVDRILFYGTAGVAVGQVNNSWGWDFVSPIRNSFSASETRAGYAAGGGIEVMVTQNTSLRAEYLHVDLGTSRTTINPFGTPFSSEFKNTADIGRVGLNWRW